MDELRIDAGVGYGGAGNDRFILGNGLGLAVFGDGGDDLFLLAQFISAKTEIDGGNGSNTLQIAAGGIGTPLTYRGGDGVDSIVLLGR